MIDSIKNDIEQINSNLSVLPTNTKKNVEKYNEYLNECLTAYENKLAECEAEVDRRKTELVNKYESLPLFRDEVEINYDSLKSSDLKCASNEKMSINYLLYKLRNSSSDGLAKMNDIILLIIKQFKKVGINLTEKDFQHTENVNLYIKTLLTSVDNIQNVFNDIYFKDPNIISEISLNVWYLYYKNKSKIDAFYKSKYEKFDFENYISAYRTKFEEIENTKRSNERNIYNRLVNEELDIGEYLDFKKIDELSKSLLVNSEDERNYNNLIEYRKSLLEYAGYSRYKFIIDDFKELYTHKEEYKDLFSNKLKDIEKEEKNLFSLNKKINKKGLFKPNKQKLADAKYNRDKSIEALITLYNELDELAIKETIKNHFSTESTYYDVLKFTTYNFNYFASLIEKRDGEINILSIERNMLDLNSYIYDRKLDILDHINVADDKDILAIVSQKYKLNGLVVDEEKISSEQSDKIVNNIERLLINYDIKGSVINLEEVKYIIDSSKELTKKD